MLVTKKAKITFCPHKVLPSYKWKYNLIWSCWTSLTNPTIWNSLFSQQAVKTEDRDAHLNLFFCLRHQTRSRSQQGQCLKCLTPCVSCRDLPYMFKKNFRVILFFKCLGDSCRFSGWTDPRLGTNVTGHSWSPKTQFVWLEWSLCIEPLEEVISGLIGLGQCTYLVWSPSVQKYVTQCYEVECAGGG